MSPTTNAPMLNNFSEALTKLLEAATPKPGDFLIFERIHRVTPMDALNEENQAVQYNAVPGPYRVMRRETIIDPGTGRPITLANVVDYSPNPTSGQLEPVIEDISFQPGLGHRIQVGPDNPVLLARLLLSDKNKDSINPRKRLPEAGYVWQLLKPAAEAEDTYEREMKTNDALSIIRALETDEEALALVVEKLSLPTEDRGRRLTTKELLVKLVALAKNSPESVVNAVEAGESKLEQLIAKAEKHNIIDFVEERNEWVYKATQEPITQAVVGYKPAVSLIRYIQNNAAGLKFSQTLSARVKVEEKKADGKK